MFSEESKSFNSLLRDQKLLSAPVCRDVECLSIPSCGIRVSVAARPRSPHTHAFNSLLRDQQPMLALNRTLTKSSFQFPLAGSVARWFSLPLQRLRLSIPSCGISQYKVKPAWVKLWEETFNSLLRDQRRANKYKRDWKDIKLSIPSCGISSDITVV